MRLKPVIKSCLLNMYVISFLPELGSCIMLCVCVLHRCNLASVMLQLMAMGIRDVLHFDFMDKPSAEVGKMKHTGDTRRGCLKRFILILKYKHLYND